MPHAHDPLRDPRKLAELEAFAAAVAPARIVVVGAAALMHHRPGRVRTTFDVDLAVAGEFADDAAGCGWSRAQPPRQRWTTRGGFPVDLLPAGPSDLARGHVEWADGSRMSLVGFDLVMAGALPVEHSGVVNLRVADLAALAVCKIVAWSERMGDRDKDLRDLAVILETYVEPGADRFHDEVPVELDFDARGAYLLGADLGRRGTPEHRRVIESFVARMQAADGRAASVFLTHARQVGRWNDDLVQLRIGALRRGLSAATDELS